MLLPSYLLRSRHGIYYFRLVLSDRFAALLGSTNLSVLWAYVTLAKQNFMATRFPNA
jgi:hypothetical protein